MCSASSLSEVEVFSSLDTGARTLRLCVCVHVRARACMDAVFHVGIWLCVVVGKCPCGGWRCTTDVSCSPLLLRPYLFYVGAGNSSACFLGSCFIN